ncbi:hypothetical protein L7F22_032380 [Adiantum nelumboides]|nr:hypothetical protein [Adiantum nelumboides]
MGDQGYGEADEVQKEQGGLPAFCRFGASIVTSDDSKTFFEVWLPLPGQAPANTTAAGGSNQTTSATAAMRRSDGNGNGNGTDEKREQAQQQALPAPRDNWRGRLLFSGNGGQRGAVSYPDMKQALTRYREAAAGTNGGHFGTGSGTKWTIGHYQSQVDFGHRGVHVSTIVAQQVVKHFYGVAAREGGQKKHGFGSYWRGCSTGGRQGFAEAQRYPRDYDAILAGSPAISYNYLNAIQIHVNFLQSDKNSSRYIPESLYPVIHRAIIGACDLQDGIQDNVLEDPTRCKVNFDLLLGCASLNRTDHCLSADQLANLRDIYTALRYPNGDLIHDSVLPGSEESWTVTDGVVGTPFPPAPGWYQYQVLNLTGSPDSFDYNKVVEGNFSLIAQGQDQDPGGTNTDNPNLSPFLEEHGGKIIHYHGLADQLIPSGSSIRYYNEVQDHMGYYDLDAYRLFRIPGMAHCRGGDGAWNFGGASQTSDVGSRPLKFDAEHDAYLALAKWAEEGIAPTHLIGAAYKDSPDEKPTDLGTSSDKRPFSNGVKFTHRLCPYPKVAKLNENAQDPYDANDSYCRGEHYAAS